MSTNEKPHFENFNTRFHNAKGTDRTFISKVTPRTFFTLLSELTVNPYVECTGATQLSNTNKPLFDYEQTFRIGENAETNPWQLFSKETPDALDMMSHEFMRLAPKLYEQGTYLRYVGVNVQTCEASRLRGDKAWSIYGDDYAERMMIRMFYQGSDGEMYRHHITMEVHEIDLIKKHKKEYVHALVQSMYTDNDTLATQELNRAMDEFRQHTHYVFLKFAKVLDLPIDATLVHDDFGRRVLTHNLSRYEPMFKHNELVIGKPNMSLLLDSYQGNLTNYISVIVKGCLI